LAKISYKIHAAVPLAGLVDHVEAIWDEVEAEIEQQGGFEVHS
jgi:hypothetical protein